VRTIRRRLKGWAAPSTHSLPKCGAGDVRAVMRLGVREFGRPIGLRAVSRALRKYGLLQALADTLGRGVEKK